MQPNNQHRMLKDCYFLKEASYSYYLVSFRETVISGPRCLKSRAPSLYVLEVNLCQLDHVRGFHCQKASQHF